MKNTLVIAAAGSGKTTYLVEEALKRPSEDKILITTYSISGEDEIRKKIIDKNKCIPANITIQSWFSFLLQHVVKPFQGSVSDVLQDNDIKGIYFTEGYSSTKYCKKDYFSKNWLIYSDKVSKFIFEGSEEVRNNVISRIAKIYPNIYIDEAQDLVGYDVSLIMLLFNSCSNMLLFCDPRQTIYSTHHTRKNKTLTDDGSIPIDEETLKYSHRNNKFICLFSSMLYHGEYKETEPCKCKSGCKNIESVVKKIEHIGVFTVREKDINSYLEKYKPTQLRYMVNVKVNDDYDVYNFGKSKGKTFNRVLIYPTSDMEKKR